MALLQKAYLGATPLFRNTAWFEDDLPARGSSSAAVTVTASSTAHTKGSWSELVASTSTVSDFVLVYVSSVGFGGAASGTLLDIGKGASGSETPIAQNVAIGSAASGTNGIYFAFAANIPTGTRISARIQAVRTTPQTASVQIFTFNFGGSLLVPSTVDVLGVDTATSRGTGIAANNTWTEIVASTSTDYIGLAFVPSASASVLSNLTGIYELGIGASGSEQVVGFFEYLTTTSEVLTNSRTTNFVWLFGKDIPAGSRLAIRQDQNTTVLDGCIIGIPKP